MTEKEKKVDEFYNICVPGTLRQAIADELMSAIPALNKLSGLKYYEVEDAIVDFIHKHQDEIAKIANMEVK